MGQPRFHLSKWYLDCVGSNGAAFVGYRASLRWGLLHLEVASTLAIEGVTRARRTLRPGPAPALDGTRVGWRCARLGVQGRWDALDPPVERTLLDGPAGLMRWTCLQPRAHATVTVAGRTITGLGYVERLDLERPPWSLGFDELRWGRALSDDHSVVWIDWRGTTARTLAFLDGAELADVSVTDDVVLARDLRLVLSGPRTVREGALGRTALAFEIAQRALPSSVLRMQEHKWISDSTLTLSGRATRPGRAIHEVVRWP